MLQSLLWAGHLLILFGGHLIRWLSSHSVAYGCLLSLAIGNWLASLILYHTSMDIRGGNFSDGGGAAIGRSLQLN